MSQAPFVINPALVAIVNDYSEVNARNRGYIADQVIPRTRVDSPDFRYPEYPIDEAFAVYDTQVDRLGRLNEVVSSAGEATGSTKDWGLMEPVPYRDQAAAQASNLPFNLLARAARNVTGKVQLSREIRAATMLFSAGNYQNGYKQTLAGTGAGGQWSAADSKPVALIQDVAAGMLLQPNVAVMGLPVRNILARHADISVSLGGAAQSGRIVPDSEIASVLGVERIIVGNTIRATSKRGQALTTGSIWGKHLALLNIPGAGADGMVDANDPAFAMTFQWGEKVAGTIEDPYIGLWGGQRVKAGESLVEKLVAPFGGYLFTNAVA
jgi:hypothetical protein